MTKTSCYKCQAEIEVEEATTVHPLCEACEQSWLDWFNEQLNKLDK